MIFFVQGQLGYLDRSGYGQFDTLINILFNNQNCPKDNFPAPVSGKSFVLKAILG